MNAMKVINKTTGEISYATYGHNRLGNLRMWVEGRFYSDKNFDKMFSRLDSAMTTARTPRRRNYIILAEAQTANVNRDNSETFVISAYNTREAAEIGRRRCQQWNLKFISAKRK